MRPPQRQRLQFIESMVLWEGSVQRQRVHDVFGVSQNHITKDLQLYRKLSPHNLTYDVSSRVWRATRRFKPLVSKGDPDEYLNLLQLEGTSGKVAGLPVLQHVFSSAATPSPQWPTDPGPLREVMRARHGGKGVRVIYQTLSSPEPAERILWPHALVFEGFRWHVRAYDSKREEFRDFVLFRITDAQPTTEPAPRRPDEDVAWQTLATVELVPNPKFTPQQQEVVALEYGMTKTKNEDWCWSAQMRQSLVGYFLHWHQLLKPSARSLVIARNLPELKHLAFEDRTE